MDADQTQRAARRPPVSAAEDRRLLDTAHSSLVAYMRLLATTGGGEVEEGPGHLAFAGAHEYPGTYTNGVIRTDPAGEQTTTPTELLACSDAFFGRWRRPYVVWVRGYRDGDLATELERRGFEARPPALGSPAILAERDRVAVTEAAGVEITETRDEEDFEAYLRLVGSVYELPDADLSLVERLLFSRNSLRDEGSHVYLARFRDSGVLCGGTSTYVTGSACHAAWCVVDPAARGRGVGPALLTYSARAGFRLGAEVFFGVASQMGEPVWNRVGFRTVTHYQRFVAPAPDGVSRPTSPSRARRGAARPV